MSSKEEKIAAQARKDRRQAEVKARLKTGKPAAKVTPSAGWFRSKSRSN